MGSPSADRRAAARRDHTYVDSAGAVHLRAWFTQEEAQQAVFRLFAGIGRRYSHYACRDARCGGWHIKPCRRRPSDMARELARSA